MSPNHLVPVLALVLLTSAGCAGAPALESELTRAIDEPDAETLVLSSLDAVEGDEFLVICPYESTDSIRDRLGFDWSDAPDYSQRDDRQTVAIIEGDEVTTRVDLDREDVDFCSDGGWTVLATDTALDLSRSGDSVQISPPSP